MNKNIQRIVLVNPYYQKRTKAIAQITIGPPLGLAYLAAVLESSGYAVYIIDANAECLTAQEVAKRILQLRADLVGLTAVTPTIGICQLIASEVKKTDSSLLIVIGGIHATVLPFETMQECRNFDFLVKGEGEFVLLDLVNGLNNNKNLSEIKGLGYRDKDGVIINDGQGLIENLDILPRPARHLLKNNLYMTFDSSRMTSMIAMRGCPAKCIYCAVTQVAGRLCRKRSPAKITEEIQSCVQGYKLHFIAFLDDTFTFDKAWTHSLCDDFIRNELHKSITWSCLTRVDNVDASLLRHLKEAGCIRVEFGIESGSQALLDYLKKGITIEQIKDAFAQAKKIGLTTMGFVMLNVPGETKKTIFETKKLILQVEPDFLQVSLATPYPGTGLYDLCLKEGLLITKDWSEYIFLNRQIIRNNSISEKELKKLIWDIERSFHLRIKYLCFILFYILQKPARIKTMLWAGANAIKKLLIH